MEMRKPAIVLLLSISAAVSSGQLVVDTFAGGKIRSSVPAQVAFLSWIGGIAVDGAGNIVFCEPRRNIIRRIGIDGVVTTIAGTGVTGYSGDGGPALNAALNQPTVPRFDSAGDLYFADAGNYRIRRIDTRGVITTVAGDGIPLREGMGRSGLATASSLGSVFDLAVVNGAIYFSETGNTLAIRRVTAAGRIEVVDGVAPGYLAADGAGNLYANDGAYNTGAHIVRIGPDGAITKIAGYGTTAANDGQPAVDSLFQGIGFMAADANNVYFVQNSVRGDPRQPAPTRIRRVGADRIVHTLAGALGSAQPSRTAPRCRLTSCRSHWRWMRPAIRYSEKSARPAAR